jgi:transcriptional regulator with XRE-family HTH domain
METKPLRRTAIAAEVRAELARQNKTLTSLAQAADISTDTLRRRLNGLSSFPVEELGPVCRFLGLTLDQLLDRALAEEEAIAS